MKRLLCIVGGMNVGGAETFLMKVFRRLDKTKYSMDFAVAEKGKCAYDDEIESLGGKIHRITPKSESFSKNFSEIKKLVRDEKYDYVLRTSQHSLSALELFAAKLGGARTRVFRSSNSDTGVAGKKSVILHKLCKFMPRNFANVRIAPSTEAADFMYGKGSVAKGKANLLNNGIDTDIFRYSEQDRQDIRRELSIENDLVFVHIGRFNYQKNHKFLLDIFAEIVKQRPCAKLLLVGKGELEEDIRTKIEKLNLSGNVIITGVRSDVPAILSAADAFIMPSFFEGMPNTIIEAQATGLPCIISDSITKEANITGLVKYLPLSNSAEQWANECLAAVASERKDTKPAFIANKYDIDSVVNEFIRLVFGD